MKNILIIVPVYNCKNSLPSLLSGLPKKNTLLIDDGSKDSSFEIIKEKKFNFIKVRNNMGIGNAIRIAVEFGLSKDYKYCITMDGDGQHNPSDIVKFAQTVKENNFVIGNRFHKCSLAPDSKLTSNFLASLFIQNLFGKKLYDVTCGFRAFPLSQDILEIIENRYGFLHSHLLKSLIRDIDIESIDIDCKYNMNELLASRKEELLGFLSSVLKYNPIAIPAKQIRSIADKINNSISFSFTFDSVVFHAFYIERSNSYIFQTNKENMYKFYNVTNCINGHSR